ncbi:MAG: DegQ family serine endoprotease [Candidatus Binatus sp.]|jgi:serine protease Do|uniref:DegQ family serine endoprotease n=2 Tax=Candidatus Binatus sp. TaxID=2811406 RepID=UPI003C764880
MTNKWFRPIAFAGVAIFAATLILTTSRIQARAADSAPARFWSELPDGAQAAKAQSMPDFVDLAAKLSPAVVNISTDEADEPAEGAEPPEDAPNPLDPHSQGPLEQFGVEPHSKALGSGFIITKDGYILTNQHVVDSPGKVTVTTQDGHNYTAKIIGHDEKSDIALLKIDAKHDLAVAPLGDSSDLRVGEWVMAIGNPFGFDHTVTAGIVSAKGRFIPGNYEDFIQTDASINPGNSGGPLIDLRGNVIGVNCAIYTHTGQSMGIGFAVPIDLVKEELPQLKTSGKVVRGWLGVYIQKVTPELADSLGLADSRGALVAKVLDDGPAKAAGVKRGDVIVAFDKQPVDDSRELPLLVGRSDLGHKGVLTVIRDKQTIELPVTITQSREPEIVAAEEKSEKPDPGAVSPFGLHVKDLSPDLAKELGLDTPGGVEIALVQPGSAGDEAGLRSRDVILEVNRAAVKDVDAYQAALKKSAKGKIVLLLVKRGENTIYVTVKPEA